MAAYTYRNLDAGNISDLRYQLQELNTQLRDRKQQNVMLSTENARLKRQLYDLQQRLSDIEMGRDTKRGEASTMGALRLVAAQTKQRQLELSKSFEEALAAYQVVADQNTQLESVLADTASKLEAAEAGWKAARDEVSALQEQTDTQEADLVRLRDNLTAVQQTCEGLKQALSSEQQARAASEAQLGNLSQAFDQERRAGVAASDSLSALRSQHSALQASFSQQEQGLKGLVAERDATIKDLTSRLERLGAVAKTVQTPTTSTNDITGQPGTQFESGTKSLVIGQLLGASAQSSAQTATGDSQSTQTTNKDMSQPQASAPASAGTASSFLTPDTNALEICLHDVTLPGPAAGTSRWSLLQLDTPGLEGRSRVSLITDPSQTTVPLNVTYQLRFPGSGAPGGPGVGAAESALAVIASGQTTLVVHDLSRSLVGGLRCPAPAGHPQAGQVLPLLAVAHEHAPNANAVELMVLDVERGVPSIPLALLSVDWSRGGVLPPGCVAPSLDEFLVDIRGHDPLVLEAARMSGIFMPGRTIAGPGGRVYQVWGLSDPATRRSATRRFLDREFEVCPDLASSARPVATTSLPLTAALTAPPRSQVTARLMHRALLEDVQVPGPYDPAPEHGTRVVALSTPLQRPVGSATLTVRLLDELALAQALVMRGVQQQETPGGASSSSGITPPAPPAQDAVLTAQVSRAVSAAPSSGQVVAAPPLPAGHWASAMAAEYVVVARLASQLGSHLSQALARLLGSLAVEARDLDNCQQATLNCLDLITRAQQQLSGCSASCAAIADRATSSSSSDSWLAPAFARHVQAVVRRSLAQPLLLIHQLLASSSLAAGLASQVLPPPNPALVVVNTSPGSPGGGAQVAAPVPGHQQRQMAASVHSALLSAYSQVLNSRDGTKHQAGLVHVLAAAAQDVLLPHMRDVPGTGPVVGPPHEVTCMPGQRQPAVMPSGSTQGTGSGPGTPASGTASTGGVDSISTALSLPAALDALISNLAASHQGSEVVDKCRRDLALPPPAAANTLAAGAGAGAGAAARLSDEASLTAAAQQALSAVLTPATAALLQGLTAVSRAALTQLLNDSDGLAMLREMFTPSASSQLSNGGTGAGSTSVVDTGKSVSGNATSTAEALASLQVRVTSVLVRVFNCDPLTYPPATPPSAAAWFRAAHSLKAQLSGAHSLWVATSALTAARVLLLGGQRAQGMALMMDALAAEATRVTQLVQGVLSDLRVSRLYEEAVIREGLPVVAALLGAYLMQTARLVYDQPLQLLMTPLKPRLHILSQVTPWSGPPVLVAESRTSTLLLLAPWGMPGLPGEGYGSSLDGTSITFSGAPGHPQAPLARQQEEWLEGGGSGEPALMGWQPRGGVLLLVPEAVAAASGPAVAAVKAAAAALGWVAHTWPEFLGSPGMGSLPESQVVAEAAARMDAVIPLAPSQELGSLVKWFRAQGVAVLQPEADPDLHAAMSEAATATAGAPSPSAPAPGGLPTSGVSSLTDDSPVRALARALVARITLQSLYNRTGAAAAAVHAASPASTPSQPTRPHELAAAVATCAATHIPDVGAAKPLIAQARSLHQRLRAALSAFSSSLNTSALLQPYVAHMVSTTEAALDQGELLLEGALSAPAAAAGSAAIAAEAAQKEAEAAVAQRAALAVAQAKEQQQQQQPVLVDSLRSTPTRRGLALPVMPAREAGSATPPLGGVLGTPAAGAPGLPVQAYLPLQSSSPSPGHEDEDGASTASEDYEPHVAPVGVVPGLVGRPGMRGGGARVDGGESELESDAASVASASTQHGYRPAGVGR